MVEAHGPSDETMDQLAEDHPRRQRQQQQQEEKEDEGEEDDKAEEEWKKQELQQQQQQEEEEEEEEDQVEKERKEQDMQKEEEEEEHNSLQIGERLGFNMQQHSICLMSATFGKNGEGEGGGAGAGGREEGGDDIREGILSGGKALSTTYSSIRHSCNRDCPHFCRHAIQQRHVARLPGPSRVSLFFS
ncbi:hypothetical protein CBR_g19248 [Chara braunii]|uniref:Uncharacterized protein n=1 Tax=Chara braunii TaxID=69332 RepID=A0A388JTY7_CHABU|nr:hypothetical protein CBR_g19248 [Chara braunii]|eukprot:GBG61172.1 hypothetical protein CBR_g19248 [Chara braunii]